MKKLVIQGIIVIGSFFLLFFLVGRVDWMNMFQIEKHTTALEDKFGDLLWKSIKSTEDVIEDAEILAPIDSLVNRICEKNSIERGSIKLHIVKSDEINAFAMPGGHIVLLSGLILEAANQEELCGVLCHEIAHIEKGHVMKMMIKEIGLAAVVGMVDSGGGSGAAQAIKLVSSTAFDREMERDADIMAVKYMEKANIDPAPFADFLYRLAEGDPEIMSYLTWISTHPDSKERAEYIVNEISDNVSITYGQVITEETWDTIQDALKK